MPTHVAVRAARPDAPERYVTVDLVRFERGASTTLRAHFYDLGHRFVLVWVERP
ncbi:MAG TPA: hypothetical protein VHB21_10530 [Minicystis sp.]|nr:hypothetical protein [Minicystis sp.]